MTTGPRFQSVGRKPILLERSAASYAKEAGIKTAIDFMGKLMYVPVGEYQADQQAARRLKEQDDQQEAAQKLAGIQHGYRGVEQEQLHGYREAELAQQAGFAMEQVKATEAGRMRAAQVDYSRKRLADVRKAVANSALADTYGNEAHNQALGRTLMRTTGGTIGAGANALNLFRAATGVKEDGISNETLAKIFPKLDGSPDAQANVLGILGPELQRLATNDPQGATKVRDILASWNNMAADMRKLVDNKKLFYDQRSRSWNTTKLSQDELKRFQASVDASRKVFKRAAQATAKMELDTFVAEADAGGLSYTGPEARQIIADMRTSLERSSAATAAYNQFRNAQGSLAVLDRGANSYDQAVPVQQIVGNASNAATQLIRKNEVIGFRTQGAFIGQVSETLKMFFPLSIKRKLSVNPDTFGPSLHAALRAFQKRTGLTDHGFIDRPTLEMLRVEGLKLRPGAVDWITKAQHGATDRPLGDTTPAPPVREDEGVSELPDETEETEAEKDDAVRGATPVTAPVAPPGQDVPGVWGTEAQAPTGRRGVVASIEDDIAREAAKRATFVRDPQGRILSLAGPVSTAEIPSPPEEKPEGVSDPGVSAVERPQAPIDMPGAAQEVPTPVAPTPVAPTPEVSAAEERNRRIQNQTTRAGGGAASLYLEGFQYQRHPETSSLAIRHDPGVLSRETWKRDYTGVGVYWEELGEDGTNNPLFYRIGDPRIDDLEELNRQQKARGKRPVTGREVLVNASFAIRRMGLSYTPEEDSDVGGNLPADYDRVHIAREARRLNRMLGAEVGEAMVHTRTYLEQETIKSVNVVRKARLEATAKRLDTAFKSINAVMKEHNIIMGGADDTRKFMDFIMQRGINEFLKEHPDLSASWRKDFSRQDFRRKMIKYMNGMEIVVDGKNVRMDKIMSPKLANRIVDVMYGTSRQPAMIDEFITMAAHSARPTTVSGQTISRAFDMAEEHAIGLFMMAEPAEAAILMHPDLANPKAVSRARSKLNRYVRSSQSSARRALMDYEQNPTAVPSATMGQKQFELVSEGDGYKVVHPGGRFETSYAPAVRAGTGVPELQLRIFDTVELNLKRGTAGRDARRIRLYPEMRDRRLRGN